jgi:rubredoxin
MSDKGKTYRCAECGGVFEAEWTDEEAKAELKENFGDFPLELCEEVCDDCYKKIMGMA